MRRHINKIISHPLFSGSAIMIIGSNSASALNYFYHLVLGRLLGPSLYGEFVSLISVIGLLGIIPAAVSLAIVKQVSSARSEGEVNSLINWFRSKSFIVSLLFALIMLILTPFISSFLRINKVSYIPLISLLFLFSLQTGFNRSILQGVMKFKEIVVSVLTENTAKLLISIILLLFGLAVSGALMAYILSALLGLLLTNYFLRIKKKSNHPVHINFKSMAFLTFPMLIQAISITSLITSDVVLVKHFFTSHEAGIYAALSTLGKIIFFGAGPITTVMFPLVSKKNSKGESYRKVLIYSFIATALFAFGVCIFYWLWPSFAIKLLFGSAYLESSSLLVLFGVSMSLFTLSSLLVNFGISLGKNNITIFPLFYAFLQIILIFFFHNTLFSVVMISTGVTALLLMSLLIYLGFEKEFINGKSFSDRDKINIDNHSSL